VKTTPDSMLKTFFRQMTGGFEHACKKVTPHTHDFLIGGGLVQLSLAGDGLNHLVRPLAHLRAQARLPALELLAWEGPRDWMPPELVWTQGQLGFQGEVLGLGSGRFSVNYHDTSGLFTMYDRQSNKALYWIASAAALPFWELASPFRILFHAWAASLGGQVAHAAAVGSEGRGVLIVGKSGSGKSTASLMAMYQGLDFVGDDYVMLTHNPVPVAHSLYSSAKMHTDFLGQTLPHWANKVGAEIGLERKSVLFLQDIAPRQLCAALPIHAIVVPKVTRDAQPSLMPLTSSEGLLALAPSSIYQLPGARRRALDFFSGFVRDLPVYALYTGGDPSMATGLLKHCLVHPQKREKILV